MPQGDWALITGAARRIGQTLAIRAAQLGYHVIAHSRSGRCEDTLEAVQSVGRQGIAVAGDLADPEALSELIAAAPGHLSLLVNCASVFEDDRLGELTATGLDLAFATNTRAPLLLSQAFAKRLPESDKGAIINLLDQRVLRPDPRYFSYAVSRAALWAGTQMLAQALAPRIRVNAIGPGPTLPSVHQTSEAFAAEAAGVLLQTPASPDEVADAMAYLVEAKSVTGQLIAVDGGQHLGWRTPDVIDE